MTLPEFWETHRLLFRARGLFASGLAPSGQHGDPSPAPVPVRINLR